MMFTLSKESKNPNTEENLVIHVIFIRQNMFTIKTISWASQITTHRYSHCYVTKKNTAYSSQYKQFEGSQLQVAGISQTMHFKFLSMHVHTKTKKYN